MKRTILKAMLPLGFVLLMLLVRKVEYWIDYTWGDADGHFRGPFSMLGVFVVYFLLSALAVASFVHIFHHQVAHWLDAILATWSAGMRSAIKAVAGVSCTIVCLALTGELALRCQGGFPTQAGYDYDAELGWVPNYSYLPMPDNSIATILCIGDSFTQPQNGFVRAFADHLSAATGREHLVVNLGSGGYGTAQEYLMLKRHIAEYRPRLVVLAFFAWNDVADNLNDIYYSSTLSTNRPSFRLVDNTLVQARKPTYLPYWISTFSALARGINESAIRLRLSQVQPYCAFFGQYGDFYASEENNRARTGWALTEELVEQVCLECTKNEARFLLVAFDNPFTVEADVFSTEQARYGEAFAHIDQAKAMRKVSEIAARNEYAYLNLTDVFLEYKKQNPTVPLYHHDIAGHFTTNGIQLAGEEIAQFVIRTQLVE